MTKREQAHANIKKLVYDILGVFLPENDKSAIIMTHEWLSPFLYEPCKCNLFYHDANIWDNRPPCVKSNTINYYNLCNYECPVVGDMSFIIRDLIYNNIRYDFIGYIKSAYDKDYIKKYCFYTKKGCYFIEKGDDTNKFYFSVSKTQRDKVISIMEKFKEEGKKNKFDKIYNQFFRFCAVPPSKRFDILCEYIGEFFDTYKDRVDETGTMKKEYFEKENAVYDYTNTFTHIL